jgi:uncharacterized protein (UPF0303 family)
MPVDSAQLIATLQRQEEELVLDSFDQSEAWTLGVGLVELAQAAGHEVGIDIRRPGLILFRAALPGITPDQDSWIARKAALVLRMESSSALVEARLSAAGVDAAAIGWLGPEYAITGGSFPVRVRGVGVVAAITVSGLSSEDDHQLAVEGIRRHRQAVHARLESSVGGAR